MNGHPQFDEDLDLLALGTFEAEEKRAPESHVGGCPECSGKLEEARGRLAALALIVPLESPPAAARDRLLRRARAEAARPLGTRPYGIGRWLIPALAAAAVVLAIVSVRLTQQNRELARRLSNLQAVSSRLEEESVRERAVMDLLTAPDTLKITLVSGAARPVPEGKAFYHPQKGLLFYAANLPALPTGRTYQLWLVPTKGNPISAGVFRVDAQGNGEVVLPTLPAGIAAAAFAVTVEPSGGVPQPTGPKVLIGAVT